MIIGWIGVCSGRIRQLGVVSGSLRILVFWEFFIIRILCGLCLGFLSITEYPFC